MKAHPKTYDDLHLLNEGILGCGVADGTTGEQSGGTFVVGAPCTPDPPSANCPPGGVFGPKQNVPCQAWTAAWTDWVKQLQPNVVVLLAGGSEILDRLYRGHMTNILNPTFADYVESQLQKAVHIATARGSAHGLRDQALPEHGRAAERSAVATGQRGATGGLQRTAPKGGGAAPGPGLRAGPELLRLPRWQLHRGSRRRPRAPERRQPLRPGARCRRRLPGAGDSSLLGGPRPRAGGEHQRCERPHGSLPRYFAPQ